MKNITLLTFFEVVSSKIKCWILPKNTISSLSLQIPNLSHFGKRCFIVFTFLVAINSFAQTSPANCKLGCTSNDVQIKKAYLSDSSGNQLSPTTFVCPVNGKATVYLTLELTTNTPRVGVVIYANIKNFTPPSTVGSLITNITQCFGIPLNQPTNKVTFSQSFDWTCGNPIVLTDVFIGWGTGNSNFCTGTGFQCPGTSSKCYQLPAGQYIPIVTPTATPASLTQCSTTPGGTTAVFDLTSLNSTVTGSQTNVTVLWFTDSGLSNQITTNPSPAAYPSASATVYAKVISTISPYPYSSVAVILTVNSLPSTFTVTNGGSYCTGGIGVAVGLNGSQLGVNYQLQLNTVNTGSPITGTGSAVNFGNKTAAGTYTVVATNATTSCTSNMTGSATVTINPLPTTFTVTGGGSYCSGGVGVAVGLNGSQSGVNYQLQLNTVNTGSPIAGTGSAINFGNKTAAGTYTVVATNVTTSCTSNMTGSATVTINPLPTTFTVNGGGSYCSGGIGVAVGLNGSQSGVNYQLQLNTVNTGSPVAGTGSAISFGNQTAAGIYTVVATTTSASCTNTMTGSATVTINPLPTTFTVTGGGSYCSGGVGVAVGLNGSQSGVNYQLQLNTVNTGLPVAGTGSAISFGNQTAAGTYTVVAATISASCTNNMTGSATVTINPLPTTFTVTGGGSYCSAEVGVLVGLNGSQSGVNYQLQLNSVNTGSPLAGTASAISFGNQTAAGVYTVVATNASTLCTSNMTGNVAVTINPLPDTPTFCIVQPSLCSTAKGSVTINSPCGLDYEYSIKNGVNGTWQSAILFDNLNPGDVTGIKVRNKNTGCVSNAASCNASNCSVSPCQSTTGKIASTDTKTAVTAAPIEAKTTSTGFDAYPVPFKDQLSIKYKFDYKSDVKIEVFNAQGISVLSKTDNDSYLDKELTLDLKASKRQDQVYVVKVTTNQGTFTKKVMSSK